MNKFRSLAVPLFLACMAAGLSGCGASVAPVPGPAKDMVAVGNAAYDRGDYTAACRDLSEAGISAGAHTLVRAGDACIKSGRQRAIDAYQAAASADPGDAAAMEGLGMTAYADGDLDRARQMLEAAAKAGGKNPRAALALGNIALVSGQCDKALAAYQEALHRDLTFAVAKQHLEAARVLCGSRREPATTPVRKSSSQSGGEHAPGVSSGAGSARDAGKTKTKVIDLNDI